MEDWTGWLQRLRAIAQTGLSYTVDPFDRERYQELAGISQAMQAALLDIAPSRLDGVFELDGGYPTPKIEVRAGVFKGNEILLVRELADQRWALPGGWCDQGISPRGNAAKEVFEETGLTVRVEKLAAIRDEAVQTYRPKRLEQVYKLLFLCKRVQGDIRVSMETPEVGYFPIDELPELSLGRTIPEDILLLAEHRINARRLPDID